MPLACRQLGRRLFIGHRSLTLSIGQHHASDIGADDIYDYIVYFSPTTSMRIGARMRRQVVEEIIKCRDESGLSYGLPFINFSRLPAPHHHAHYLFFYSILRLFHHRPLTLR